jgi:heptosyltransferase-1
LPTLKVSPAAEAGVLGKLAAHGLASGSYAVLAPFTTRPQKHWFEDAWQALAPQLIAATGLVPVILGGPADAEAAARIAADPRIVNLAGQTRLPEAVAAIAHSALLIGVDTGLTTWAPRWRGRRWRSSAPPAPIRTPAGPPAA